MVAMCHSRDLPNAGEQHYKVKLFQFVRIPQYMNEETYDMPSKIEYEPSCVGSGR
jgi:hypothetical protein